MLLAYDCCDVQKDGDAGWDDDVVACVHVFRECPPLLRSSESKEDVRVEEVSLVGESMMMKCD
jgi:hypothetical protein